MKSSIVATTLIGLACTMPVYSQDMLTPAFVVGDRWSYRETDLLTKLETSQLTEKLVSADAAEYRIDARRVARTWWRGDAANIAHREQFAYSEAGEGRRGKVIATSDGGCAFPWPLKDGMTFECSEKALAVNGWKLRFDLEFAVEAAESVETPAGKFETLRVVGKGFVDNETTDTISRVERVVWLSPAAKREVKTESRTILKSGQIWRVDGRELVAFTAGGT